MKKTAVFVILLLICSMNAKSIIVYVYDDGSEYYGGYYSTYTPPVETSIPTIQSGWMTFTGNYPVLTEINYQKSEIREEMSLLRELIACETDPSLRAYYQSKLANYEAQLATVQAISQAELNAVAEKQSYVLNLLTNILKLIQDTIMSIVRSIG